MSGPDGEVLRAGRELKARILSLSGDRRELSVASNELLSQFFRGFPIDELRQLLRHRNEHVITAGLFIAEELHHKASSVVDDIIPHLKHKNLDVRYSAYEALGSCTSTEVSNAFVHIVLGMLDSDILCRGRAMFWMMRVEDSLFNAALRALESHGLAPGLQEGLRMLLGEQSQDPATVRSWILHDDPLARKFGMIAAGRSAESHPELLNLDRIRSACSVSAVLKEAFAVAGGDILEAGCDRPAQRVEGPGADGSQVRLEL